MASTFVCGSHPFYLCSTDLIIKTWAFLREQMTKIGFRAAYFLGCEHLEDGGHTPKIVVLVSTEEVDMDYFCFLFIHVI